MFPPSSHFMPGAPQTTIGVPRHHPGWPCVSSHEVKAGDYSIKLIMSLPMALRNHRPIPRHCTGLHRRTWGADSHTQLRLHSPAALVIGLHTPGEIIWGYRCHPVTIKCSCVEGM
jgi:hypothetical protein